MYYDQSAMSRRLSLHVILSVSTSPVSPEPEPCPARHTYIHTYMHTSHLSPVSLCQTHNRHLLCSVYRVCCAFVSPVRQDDYPPTVHDSSRSLGSLLRDGGEPNPRYSVRRMPPNSDRDACVHVGVEKIAGLPRMDRLTRIINASITNEDRCSLRTMRSSADMDLPRTIYR
jgi:hypothetical protein